MPAREIHTMSVQSFALRLLACLFATVCVMSPASAQSTPWKPDRRVTVVVPYSTGGGTDAIARAVARQLQTIWDQPVVVENLPGADGLIGSRKVIEAKPDGYTLLVQLPSLALIRHLPNFKGADPLPALDPVSAMAVLYGVMVAHTKVPGSTMGEALAWCRAAPKPCTFGTTENVARIAARMMREESNVNNLTVLNYKGGGQLVTDLVGESIDLSLMGITAALPHVKSGKLKILATLAPKRSPVIPDVQTAAEGGIGYLDFATWYGFFAPKGTPATVQEGIATAVREAVRDESVLKVFATLGADAMSTTPAQFSTLVRKEADRMDTLVKRYPVE
jgi:tripartite-type tricarboxylate transporter receptor subunit TctC